MTSNTQTNLNGILDALDQLKTPAFVLNESAIRKKLDIVESIQKATNGNILYAMKPLTNLDAIRIIAPHVRGLSTSSLFEAKLAAETLGRTGSVHMTSPGIRPDEIEQLASICDYIVFNSVNQYDRFHPQILNKSRMGLRVNPQISFVKDKRYNPCRKHSKLGVLLSNLTKMLEDNPTRLKHISGMQFHSNCDSTDFAPLLTTVKHIINKIGPTLSNLEWFNLGGGYLLHEDSDYTPLFEAIDLLQKHYNLRVYLEPGAAFVREAGCIVSSVIDLFDSGGQTIAILDTSINHMQEIYEYQFDPEIYGQNDEGKYSYLLAGSTCLAGDLFGIYDCNTPLKIGSKLVFTDMGAYTQVKAHMFNGVNIPHLYLLNDQGLQLRKNFTYADFISRC